MHKSGTCGRPAFLSVRDLDWTGLTIPMCSRCAQGATSSGMAQAGHDFALTRNGHGAGFWDGDWPVYGDLLTKASESFGEIDPYAGDDGLIYS